MLVIIWEYQVRADHAAQFERIYSGDGSWAGLFQRSKGFIGTQLLRDVQQPYRYVTIDRWVSAEDYDAFLSQWKTEYARLDAQCDELIEQETLLGMWESRPHKTE